MEAKVYEYGQNWVVGVQAPHDLVKKLDAEILSNLDNLLADKENYTCKGESVQQFWLQKQDKTYIKEGGLSEAVSEYTQFVGDVCSKAETFNSQFLSHLRPYGVWTVRGGKGSFHKVHQHNAKGSVLGISSVLYLNVPQTNDDTQPNNNIYFVMNSGPTTVFSPDQPSVVEISPKCGELYIFPNWLLHGTYPQSEGLRQTFNIDYSVV